MEKNNIGDLRDHLFDTIQKLKDGSMTVETANAICKTGKVIVDSAKVEVQFLNVAEKSEGMNVSLVKPTGFFLTEDMPTLKKLA